MPDTDNLTNNKDIDTLEAAYNQVVSQSSVSNTSSLSDEKQKLESLLVEIDKLMTTKKSIVEKKLADLKTLKTDIEQGLEELKKIESKKDTLKSELDKIEKVENEAKEIETEVANISTDI